jgi:hypothetical protein
MTCSPNESRASPVAELAWAHPGSPPPGTPPPRPPPRPRPPPPHTHTHTHTHTQSHARHIHSRPTRPLQRLPSSMRHAVWLRKPSLLGGLYLLLTAAFPAAGLAYFFAPQARQAWAAKGDPLCCARGRIDCRQRGACPRSHRAGTSPMSSRQRRSACGCCTACPLQYTLYHALGYVYGKSTLCVWRAVGWGLATLAPAITYTLKVGRTARAPPPLPLPLPHAGQAGWPHAAGPASIVRCCRCSKGVPLTFSCHAPFYFAGQG